jgi:hypothetical protein
MMKKKKKLSKRQLDVLADLFDGQLTEREVLDKYKVGRNLFSRWISDETFVEQFDMRIAAAYRCSAAAIANRAKLAVDKLIELTKSQKTETARRACLDIIEMSRRQAGLDEPSGRDAAPGIKSGSLPDPDNNIEPAFNSLSEQAAGKLLAALAEE